MYNWIDLYSKQKAENKPDREMNHRFDEIKRLKKELAQVTQERDILKKAKVSSRGQSNTLLYNKKNKGLNDYAITKTFWLFNKSAVRDMA